MFIEIGELLKELAIEFFTEDLKRNQKTADQIQKAVKKRNKPKEEKKQCQ